jgi:diaminopimelate decarboxylase
MSANIQARLPDAGVPWTESLDLSSVQTPGFVFSADAVRRRIGLLKEALGTKVIISFKASNQQDLLSRLPSEYFDGIEVASRGELHMIAGLQSRHFYVNTPALNESLVRATLGARARFILDTPPHLEMIARLRGARKVEPITLRLSNKLIAQFSPGSPSLRDDQFGMDIPQVVQAIRRAAELGIEIDGLHLYAGPHTFAKAARHVVEAMRQIVQQVEVWLGYPIKVLNLGGGLEENWIERGHDFVSYRVALATLPSRYELLHEFGRAIFSDCGVFAVRVLQSKSVCGKRYVVCDGGMAQAFLLSQTENMMRRYRTPWVYGRTPEVLPEGDETIITGSTCSRDDVIGLAPYAIEAGDMLVFENCGAYTRTYSMNNFLQLGEASSYVV